MMQFHKKHAFLRSLTGFLMGLAFSSLSPSLTACAQKAPMSTVHARVDRWVSLMDTRNKPTLSEYATFLVERPLWPRRAIMLARFQNILTATKATRDLKQFCPAFPLTNVQALNHCAPYLNDTHDQALKLWEAGRERDGEETLLLNLIGSGIDPAVQMARYRALMTRGRFAAAQKQVNRLSNANRRIARVELAFVTKNIDAEALYSTLPSTLQHHPRVLLPYLRWLRLSGRPNDAVQRWKSTGFAVQAKHPLHDWMKERLRLAYDRLAANDVVSASEMVTLSRPHDLSSIMMDAHFLAGWIALKRTHDYLTAGQEFTVISQRDNLIQRARGFYWLAQVKLAQGDHASGMQMLRLAGRYPTTYYGQLAIAAQDREKGYFDLSKNSSPGLRRAVQSLPPIQVATPPRSDLTEAARYLASEGRMDDAEIFLIAAWSNAASLTEMAAFAKLSVELKIYRPAVFAARKAGAQGVALFPEGWQHPTITVPPTVFPIAFSWAVARQESSYDPNIVSPANAVGLMQLLLPTAREMALQIGVTHANKLTIDALKNAELNMQLGTYYLTYLLGQFQNMPHVALAAYNAGPTRARRWLQARAITPDSQDADIVDWVENVPFGETRAYIQRVMKNFRLLELRAENDQ